MNRRRFTLIVGMLVIATYLPALAQEKAEVKLDVVKYEALKDAVARNRGKVVLVDFWGSL